MKTFLEYCTDISEAGFEAGGKKYTYSFGRYYRDGEKISKEEYYAAKPSKPEKEKKRGKKSEEPAKDVKKQDSEEKIERDSEGRRIVTVNGYKFTLEPDAEKIYNTAFDAIKKEGKNYKFRYERQNLIIDTDNFTDKKSIFSSLTDQGYKITKPRWAIGNTYRVGPIKNNDEADGYIRTDDSQNETFKNGISIQIKCSPVIDKDFPKQTNFSGSEAAEILKSAIKDELTKLTNNRCFITSYSTKDKLVIGTNKKDSSNRPKFSSDDSAAIRDIIYKYKNFFENGLGYDWFEKSANVTLPAIEIKQPKEAPAKQKSKTDFGKLEWEDSHDIAFEIGDVLGGEWSTIDDKEIAFDIDPDEILTRDNKLRPSIKKKLDTELEKIKKAHGIECDWEYDNDSQEFILKVV